MNKETAKGNRDGRKRLSDGERKTKKSEISIARIILRNPGLIIFDEATSLLDSISERLIQDAIDPLLSGKTSLTIAHRLSTIMSADEIIVVEKGEIVEKGTYNELIGKSGVYTELYETQFKNVLGNAKG